MVKKMILEELKFHRGAIVVSAGGHLEQAIRRVRQLELQNNVTFVIPRNAQSETRLANHNRIYIRNVGSRDVIGLCRAFFQLLKILKKKKFEYVLSTGAGIALACFIVCKFKKIDFYYIESIARIRNPSLTGRILSLSKTSNLYTESSYFNKNKWKKIDTLFSVYRATPRISPTPSLHSIKIFVTVGTVHKYKFSRLIDVVNAVLCESDQVVWQIGDIDHPNLVGTVHRELTVLEFSQKIDWADVVITHSGVGSILNILDRGKFPIIIPRLSEYREHVDDHQLEIASTIAKLGLGLVRSEALDRKDLIGTINIQIENGNSIFND